MKRNFGELVTIAETFIYTTTSPDGDKIEILELNDLNIGHLLDLCMQLGLKGCHNYSKFQLQGAIGLLSKDNTKEKSVVLAKTKNLLICLATLSFH